jgi:hypothetical protein
MRFVRLITFMRKPKAPEAISCAAARPADRF